MSLVNPDRFNAALMTENNADLHLRSNCHARSQADLCHCTRQPVSGQPEPTIAGLRYTLGGNRPNQHVCSMKRPIACVTDTGRDEGYAVSERMSVPITHQMTSSP